MPVQLTIRGRRVPHLAVLIGLVFASVVLGSIATALNLDWLASAFAVVFVAVVLLGGVLIVVWLLQTLARRLHRRQDLAAARRRPTPYAFNPPPGWPAPAAEWVPPVGWRPDPSWPALPEQWELWRRVAPRPAPPPRSIWEAPGDAEMKLLYRFDAAKIEQQFTTSDGREYLQKQARGLRESELRRLRNLDEEHAHFRVERSRWHPYEWAYWRALNAVADLAAAIDGRLSRVSAGAPVSAPELVDLWRSMLAWADEGIDAGSDRLAADTAEWLPAPTWSDEGDWQQAERLAAAALQQFGFTDARVTGNGNDRGLDVSGRNIAAQVKYTGAPVGRPVVQQLVGAAGGRATAFFSRSGYSQHAIQEADARGMALFTIALPSSVHPQNRAARQMSHD